MVCWRLERTGTCVLELRLWLEGGSHREGKALGTGEHVSGGGWRACSARGRPGNLKLGASVESMPCVSGVVTLGACGCVSEV